MHRENNMDVYAVKHKDELTRENSRSGGIFTALSDLVLNEQGVVYGCVLDDEFKAIHIRATDKEKRDMMRGSKYIQSKLGTTFVDVKNDLESGKVVLFSGTSCQVAGLKCFLGHEYNNLLCVDIVCHGVPSPKIWKMYLEWQEKKRSSKIQNVEFRNKKDFGWWEHIETLVFKNGKTIHSKIFTLLFYGHHIIRPSCFECPYKCLSHPGDITIADYWGIDKAAPGFNDNKGVSLVLVNNEAGKRAFDRIKTEIEYKATRIEDSMQDTLIGPFDKPEERTQFWLDVEKLPFSKIVQKYAHEDFKSKTDRKIRKLKRDVKNIISKVTCKNGK